MTTSVDMKQAVAGSTVHFRCGGSAVVYKFELAGGGYFDRTLWFKDALDRTSYTILGRFNLRDTSPFDIIRIEPPQFKWEDVRAGMAFNITGCNNLRFFIGKSVNGDQMYFETPSGEVFGYTYLNPLTRAPEHDKVQP